MVATAAAVDAPHGVRKEDKKPPRGNELKAPFDEVVLRIIYPRDAICDPRAASRSGSLPDGQLPGGDGRSLRFRKFSRQFRWNFPVFRCKLGMSRVMTGCGGTFRQQSGFRIRHLIFGFHIFKGGSTCTPIPVRVCFSSR